MPYLAASYAKNFVFSAGQFLILSLVDLKALQSLLRTDEDVSISRLVIVPSFLNAATYTAWMQIMQLLKSTSAK